jgi:hypothetical protein
MRDLFIIGAMRSGTTSLFHLLAGHPDIAYSRIKEPHYYCDDLRTAFPYNVVTESEAVRLLAENPSARLHQASVESRPVYGKLFGAGSVRLEASPSYLPSETALERIAAEAENPFAVVLLRDPEARLVSHFELNESKGWLEGLEETVRAELEEGVPLVRRGQAGLVRMSCYARDVERAIQALGPRRVLIASLERLRADPAGLCAEVCQAVGVDPAALPAQAVSGVRNVRRPVRSARFSRLATAVGLRRVARAAPEGLKRRLRAVYFRDRDASRYRPALDQVRQTLDADLARLAAIIPENTLPLRNWSGTARPQYDGSVV